MSEAKATFPYDMTQVNLRPGDVLLLRPHRKEVEDAERLAERLVAALGKAAVPVLIVPRGTSVQRVSAEEMSRQGWVRA